MCELVAVPSRFVHRLPGPLDWGAGAMVEPFAVGLQAAKSAGIRPGESAAALGAGPIGLMVLQAARIHGATTLIAIDVEESALRAAERMGATAALNAGDADVPERVRALTQGRGADHVIEAVGAERSVQAAIGLVRRGGTVTLVGIASAPGIAVDTIRLVRMGITLDRAFGTRTCTRPRSPWPRRVASTWARSSRTATRSRTSRERSTTSRIVATASSRR